MCGWTDRDSIGHWESGSPLWQGGPREPMTYFDDLSACDYFGAGKVDLLAVGWLDAGHPFSKGSVPSDFFEALAQLATNPWQPCISAGRHPCPFCVFTGGPTELR